LWERQHVGRAIDPAEFPIEFSDRGVVGQDDRKFAAHETFGADETGAINADSRRIRPARDGVASDADRHDSDSRIAAAAAAVADRTFLARRFVGRDHGLHQPMAHDVAVGEMDKSDSRRLAEDGARLLEAR